MIQIILTKVANQQLPLTTSFNAKKNFSTHQQIYSHWLYLTSSGSWVFGCVCVCVCVCFLSTV